MFGEIAAAFVFIPGKLHISSPRNRHVTNVTTNMSFVNGFSGRPNR
jgi:hypothetical protein